MNCPRLQTPTTTMNGAKEFVLVCVVFLVISCLTSAQPDTGDREHSE